MSGEKTMMRFYYSMLAALLVKALLYAQALEYKFEFLNTVLGYGLLLLGVGTFVSMYLHAKKNLGKNYAVKNSILAVVFTGFLGIGILLWPLLVRSEIRKRKRPGDALDTTI